jgi:hypothetical protein
MFTLFSLFEYSPGLPNFLFSYITKVKKSLLRTFLLTLFLLPQLIAFTQKQSKMSTIIGEYNLTGVMEMASVLRLNEDSTFQFYFAYGAADREGSGTWILQDSKVILNSKPRPPKDFKLIESSIENDKDFTIRFANVNAAFFPFLECHLKTTDKQLELKPGSDGMITAPPGDYTAIGFLFVLCGDRPSLFTDLKKGHNSYTFGIEPWICEVFFNNIRLTIKEHMLVGQHPLVEGNQFTFRKQDHGRQ